MTKRAETLKHLKGCKVYLRVLILGRVWWCGIFWKRGKGRNVEMAKRWDDRNDQKVG